MSRKDSRIWLDRDLFGCRHDNITRPIRPVQRVGEATGETYVACLNGGKRLRYDLRKMRVGKPLPREGKSTVSFQTPSSSLSSPEYEEEKGHSDSNKQVNQRPKKRDGWNQVAHSSDQRIHEIHCQDNR
jgi:hypothetical protein